MEWVADRVDFEVPLFSGAVKVDDDFFVGQLELLESDVCAVSPRTAVVRIQCELGRNAVGCCRRHRDDRRMMLS